MLYHNSQQFNQAKDKQIALIGMSGMGKTRISQILSRDKNHNWIHFSVDYHIATNYLTDIIKNEINQLLIHSEDWIKKMVEQNILSINLKVSEANIGLLSLYLAKLGNQNLGGLSLNTFCQRQNYYKEAEVNSLLDAINLLAKLKAKQANNNFILDTTGSVCEVINLVDKPNNDKELADKLSRNFLLVYIEAKDDDIEKLVERQKNDPKPMLYNQELLKKQINKHLKNNSLKSENEINPDRFSEEIFYETIFARQVKYQKLVENNGVTVLADEIAEVENTNDFFKLISSKF